MFATVVDAGRASAKRKDAVEPTSTETTGVSLLIKKLNTGYSARWRDLTETHTCDTFTRRLRKDDLDFGLPLISACLPVPETEFTICDFQTGDLLDLDPEGAIGMRSRSLLKAYWRRPEATAESIVNGWLRTGDTCTIDGRGLIRFTVRRTEMLKVRRMSVSPVEVEAFPEKHPAIIGSCVIGHPDAERRQIPADFVRLDPAHADTVAPESIRAWCRQVMATCKVPDVRIIDALSMTATGKVRKFELEKLL